MRIWGTESRFLIAPGVPSGLFALACAAFAACGSASPTGPSEQGSLRLTARISRGVIPAGETATLTFQLENPGKDAVTLTFASACQISPYIVDASGAIVYPKGGSWACAAVITDLTVPAGGSKSQEVQVRAAADASSPYVALAPGEYSAYARVRSYSVKLESAPVRFTVQ